MENPKCPPCDSRAEAHAAAMKRDREKGEWIETDFVWRGYVESSDIVLEYPTRKCSNCGKPVAVMMWDNFCPTCGADMRKEENDDA